MPLTTTKTVPDHFGNYEIHEELGHGGLSTVYLGHDRFRDRAIALKVSNASTVRNKEHRRLYEKMFFNEAHSAGLLHHPNIVEIYDAGREDDFFYIAMEYVSNGRTLSRHCNGRELLPIERVIEIAFKCAQALDYAHRQGIIHRDIKPENILLSKNGETKISDFSIALANNPAIFDTQITIPAGSPLYMSPEQMRDEPLTHHTDLFSLGVVMYQMISGKHPFATENMAVLTHKIIHDDPPELGETRPDMPAAMESIVSRLLEKNPADRYATAWELAADLSQSFAPLDLGPDPIASQHRIDTLKTIRFFQDFADAEIWELLRRARWHDHEPNTTLIKEGERGDSLFIITEGEVVVRKGDQDLVTLGPGEVVGEIGYINKVKRTASIITKGIASTMEINADLIECASEQCQLSFQKMFIQTLVARLVTTTEMLAQYDSHH